MGNLDARWHDFYQLLKLENQEKYYNFPRYLRSEVADSSFSTKIQSILLPQSIMGSFKELYTTRNVFVLLIFVGIVALYYYASLTAKLLPGKQRFFDYLTRKSNYLQSKLI